LKAKIHLDYQKNIANKLMTKMKSGQHRIMLFDLNFTGHHANYINYLIRYWGENQMPGELNIVVSPEFVTHHSHLIYLAESYSQSAIRFVHISTEELTQISVGEKPLERLFLRLKEWKLLCKYAIKLKSSHCLIMFLDTCELPLILGLKPPCSVSGIYFRPTFHYNNFFSKRSSCKERFQQWRDRFFLHQILHNPKLHTLFCLDPLVVHPIQCLYPKARVIPLADPVEIPDVEESQVESLRNNLDIHPDRKVFLLFGSIDGRKGIYKLLESLQFISPKLCQKVCLLIVGRASDSTQKKIAKLVNSVCQHQPVQIITHFEFVNNQEMQVYYQLAGVALALYQRHVGMSGILLLAAAAQTPVLSTDYGLMGELVRRYQLGLTVDSTNPEAIAQGLTRILTSSKPFYDLEKMRDFAKENATERFSATVFQHLLNMSTSKIHL
jgi:glycosyltransferase involved in cell wall biosynthesis